MVGFKDEGFTMMFLSDGKLTVHVEGKTHDAFYKSRNFMNRSKDIGYAEVEAEHTSIFLFISKTEEGDVLTMPGPRYDCSQYCSEGFKAILTIDEDNPVEAYYERHKLGIMGVALISDEDWLREQLLTLPQRAFHMALKLFEPNGLS